MELDKCPICGEPPAEVVEVECKEVDGYEDLDGTMEICQECAGELEEVNADRNRERAMYEIPVVFVVAGNSEREAAEVLCDLLEKRVNPRSTDFQPEPHYVLDSWFFPNHPEVDGNDNEVTLVWASRQKGVPGE